MLFSKVNVAGMECQNRACRSATATKNFDDNGVPTEAFYKMYEQLARGHIGLFIMEHTYVELRGHANHNQFGIHTDDMIQYHKKVVDMMKNIDPKIKIVLQLAHAGQWGYNPETKLEIDKCSVEDIKEMIESFKKAAIRAEQAGYDAVQIHSAHTYFISTSMSPYYNHRTDEYKAGSMVLEQVFKAVKGAVKIPVGVKLECDEFLGDKGIVPSAAADAYEKIQFDFFEISGGGRAPHKYMTIRLKKDGEFYYKHVLEEFQRRGILQPLQGEPAPEPMSKCPIIVTGGMDEHNAEEAIKMGASLVGFSRQFIRDPLFLTNSCQKKCVRCNYCINTFQKKVQFECIFDHQARLKAAQKANGEIEDFDHNATV